MVYKAVQSSGAGPGGVLPAGEAAGQILVWDGVSAWVPSESGPDFDTAAASTLRAAMQSFIGPLVSATTAATILTSGEYLYGNVRAVEVIGIVAYHGNPGAGTANPVSYTMLHNGVATAKVVTLDSNQSGPAFSFAGANPILSSGHRWAVQVDWPFATSQIVLPTVTLIGRYT